jgi:hypothetical protein
MTQPLPRAGEESDPVPGSRGRGDRWGWPAAVALTLLAGIAAYSAASRKAPTFDETAHLTAGVSYWRTGDFRLHPENGNLPQRLGGALAAASGARFPPLDQPAWARSAVYELGNQFLYHEGNDPDSLIAWARAAMLPLALGLWLAIYAEARRMYGPLAALCSLLLAATDPNLLAHAPLVTSDLAATLFLFLAVGAIWRILHGPSTAVVAWSSIAASALFLSKMSAGILVPIALLLMLLRLARGGDLPLRAFGRERVLQGRVAMLGAFGAVALVHLVTVVVIVWAAFGFRYEAFHAGRSPQEQFEAGLPNLLGTGSWVGSGVAAAQRGRLLPEAYLYGFSFALDQSIARPTFMAGEVRPRGRLAFFPYAFAVKTPDALLAALALAGVLATGLAVAGGRDPRTRPLLAAAYRAAPCWALVVIYGGVALNSGLNIGLRHLLPIYPALLVLAGSAVAGQAGGLRRAAMAGCLLLAAGSAVAAWPDFLAYFNLLSGGSQSGYRKLVDSSLDWGQDLPAFAEWEAREGVGPGYLSYFGTASPDHYGIRAQRLPGFFDFDRPRRLEPLVPGWYALSASMLQVYGAPTAGPWDRSQERMYQDLRAEVEGDTPLTAPRAYEGAAMERFDRFRLGRLCAYLRHRTPTAQVGGSILIFRLNEAEVAEALTGPPPYGW